MCLGMEDKNNNTKKKLAPQRKTTLKWNESGELAEEDMAKILDKLSNPDLTECKLTCEIDS